ncbi:MAG: molybdopterin-dependent oxidoreductase [Acidimicrobiales bacterium]
MGEAEPAPDAPEDAFWTLDVDGLIERPRRFALTDLTQWTAELAADIHCVTGWTRRGLAWEGAPLAALLDAVGVSPGARFVRFEACSARRHDTSLPLGLARADTWLCWRLDGAPLSRQHGGPLRTVTPSRWFYKSVKWVRRIELLAEDRLGWWERESAYHNGADPWAGDQRFTTGSIRPDQLRRFLAADRYDKWRGRQLIGVDLRSWRAAGRDLRGLVLKGCDLRGVDLRDADLREANLSLCDLRDATLAGATCRDADLEGVDLRGADLRGADLSGCALAAVKLRGALLDGVRWAGAVGLLEEAEALLRAAELSRRRR